MELCEITLLKYDFCADFWAGDVHESCSSRTPLHIQAGTTHGIMGTPESLLELNRGKPICAMEVGWFNQFEVSWIY